MGMDFTPVRKARLTQGEFAKLCGVSRLTTNTWLREERPAQPHRLLQFTVTMQLQRLSEAVAMGLLPLSGTVRRDARLEHIRQALVEADKVIEARTTHSNP